MQFDVGLLLLSVLLGGALCATNYVKNPGLESLDGWDCPSCHLSLSTDSHGGSHSLKITSRQHDWSVATQTLYITPDRIYVFRAWVKIHNTANGKLYHDLTSMLELTDKNGKVRTEKTGITPYVQPGAWHIVGGDFYLPPDIKGVRYYIHIKEPGVNYLLDDVQASYISYEGTSSDGIKQNIDKYRKANVTMKFTTPDSVKGLKVELQQTKSEFGWGSAVQQGDIVGDNNPKYREFFFDLFEWGVLESYLKWPPLEPIRGHPDYSRALHAVDYMKSRGIKVRGHNVFWGGKGVVPSWQHSLTAAELKPELLRHIKEMSHSFKGRFEHWDVNNENLHLHYYEEKLHDPKITQWMFREMRKYDHETKLYLNEFEIVNSNNRTLAYLDQALQYKAQGVPVDGLGIQSHLGYVGISLIKHRVDEVAKAGFPIWITELDIDEKDEHKKADKYERLMSLYFSHPAIKGVMFWGFWNGHHWHPDAAMADGPNITPNAAGRKIQELLKHTWRTNETHNLHGSTVQTRAFKGSYKLLVHQNGKVIHTQNFTLNRDGTVVNVDLKYPGIIG